ncbi:putative integrase catalytic subunit [Roseibium sp. TrichSKD4]|uniref:integrase catalytic domain-containing protein n=1 Tax=Roseibium sp. TrichSKD4 TaxID=744980 RepID=UPI0001E56C68|nr:DDE-type integrase/transposase/recombinase [Roseibium sp. TrichSKD4]EFO30186.1 putative integrase catalytic subunit [Roseibium sp. TrichSKD4]
MSETIENSATFTPQRYSLSDRDSYSIEGIECRLIASDDHQHVFKQRSGASEIRLFDHVQFSEALMDGSIMIHKKKTLSRSATDFRRSNTNLRDLPAKEKERILFYRGLCKFFDAKRVEYEQGICAQKVNLGATCLEWLLPQAKDELRSVYNQKGRSGQAEQRFNLNLPTSRHFARLYRAYQRHAGSTEAFVHQYRSPSTRAGRTNPDELQIRNQFVCGFASPKRPSMAHQRREYERHIRKENARRRELSLPKLKPVCRKTFERNISELDQFNVTAQRHGEKYALAKYRSSGIGFDYIQPLERVEMDEWKLDLIVILTDLGVWSTLAEEERAAVKRARLWATVAIDVATRCVLAFKIHLKDPCGETALETLELALTDKSEIADFIGASCSWPYHGMIETLVTDNGAAFTSEIFETGALSLGIELTRPRAGDARARPHIERSFKTFSQTFLNEYSGRTFSNVLEKGDRDPKKEATMFADTIARGILRQAIDIYHRTGHENLGGESPRNAWMRLTHKHAVEAAPDRDELRACLGIDQEGVVGSEGIHFLGLKFNSEYLQTHLFGETVPYRVSRLDISTISVWNDKLNEWVDVKATVAPPPDMSIYEWTIIAGRHEAEHGANVALDIAEADKAAQDVKQDARVAELRAGINPLHDRGKDRKWLERLNNQRFSSLRVIEGETAPKKTIDLSSPRGKEGETYERPVHWVEADPVQQPIRYQRQEEEDVSIESEKSSANFEDPVAETGSDDDASDISFE